MQTKFANFVVLEVKEMGFSWVEQRATTEISSFGFEAQPPDYPSILLLSKIHFTSLTLGYKFAEVRASRLLQAGWYRKATCHRFWRCWRAKLWSAKQTCQWGSRAMSLGWLIKLLINTKFPTVNPLHVSSNRFIFLNTQNLLYVVV